MREFFNLRVTLYERRKDFMLKKLQKDVETISSKVRFILGVINEEIKVNKVKRQMVIKKLR
jgi:DNA topoisomerase-2